MTTQYHDDQQALETPASSDDFFCELKEWSARKLALLKKYLSAAATILQSVDTVYYVDGFAGRGTYGIGRDAKGSPLLAAELASQFSSNPARRALQCINVEAKPEYFANLCASTTQYGNLVLNLPGTFTDNLDHILQIITNKPTVFFIDPFGVKGIEWDAMVKIIHRDRRAPLDIWIRFDLSRVRQLRGWYRSDAPGAEKKFGLLMKLYGISDADTLFALLDGPTPDARNRAAVDLYEKRLVEEFVRAKGRGFAASYRIGAITGQTKYYLTNATASDKGAILASDIVYGVEETYERELQEYRQAQSLQPTLFSLDPTRDEVFRSKVDRLKESIWEASHGKKLTRIEIHIAVWEEWFGKITGRHLTQALKELRTEGRIVDIQGAPSKEDTLITFAE